MRPPGGIERRRGGLQRLPDPQKNRSAFADMGRLMEEALRRYRDESVADAYPPEENTFHMEAEEHEKFLALMAKTRKT